MDIGIPTFPAKQNLLKAANFLIAGSHVDLRYVPGLFVSHFIEILCNYVLTSTLNGFVRSYSIWLRF